MPTIINATTTGLTVTPDNSGQLTLSANGVTALTANTAGNINFAKQPTIGGVEWPAFSVYPTGSQTLSTNTLTKITWDTEVFDTNNNFASSRFTPTVAGYYLINALVNVNSSYCRIYLAVYKNGSLYHTGPDSGSSSVGAMPITDIVYLNGTTDYIEIYAQFGTGQNVSNSNLYTWFNGCLLRAA